MKNLLIRAAMVVVLSVASFHTFSANAQMQPQQGGVSHPTVPIPTCGECGR